VGAAWRLAVPLGHTAALRRLVESWPDELWTSPDWGGVRGLPFVCGVRDPEFSKRHLVRLGMKPIHAGEAAIWLLHTGDTMLTPVLELARRAPSADDAQMIVTALGEVGTDAARAALLELARDGKAARAAAKAWWTAQGTVGVTWCARLLSTETEARGLAEDWLWTQWRGARRADVEAALRADESAAGRALLGRWTRLERDEIGLAEAPGRGAWKAPARWKRLPDWVKPEALPQLTRRDRRLADELSLWLLELLCNGELGHAAIVWVRAEMDEASRERWWMTLVDEWCLAGTGKKDNWCLDVPVVWRGAGTAANLARLITSWPAESQHQKAAHGLECLRRMGDAPALQALVGIAQRTRFAGLRARAETCVAEIAAELGLTPDELADTSVPACGLDVTGRREFAGRGRGFIAQLAPGGVVRLQAPDGRGLKNPPKSAATDEGAAARAKEWSAFNKTLLETVKTQRARLELALAGGRRWRPVNFERCVAAHPVMRMLAATLVWAEYDDEGMARGFFTVSANDGRLIDPEGAAHLATADGREIGLAHPLQMDGPERVRWQSWLADAAFEQAVEQLHRQVEPLPEDQADKVALADFSGRTISGATLRRRMDGLGWRRGVPLDAGIFYEYARIFPAAGVTAVIETSGQTIVTGEDFDLVEVKRVFFVAGAYEPVEYPKHEYALALGLVDAVACSETMRALRLALRPAKTDDGGPGQ
jgi:hypothetical protein